MKLGVDKKGGNWVLLRHAKGELYTIGKIGAMSPDVQMSGEWP